MAKVPQPTVHEQEVADSTVATPDALACHYMIAMSLAADQPTRPLDERVRGDLLGHVRHRGHTDDVVPVVVRTHDERTGTWCPEIDERLARDKPFELFQHRRAVPARGVHRLFRLGPVAVERWAHGSCRDIERLVEIGAKRHCDGNRDDEDIQPFAPSSEAFRLVQFGKELRAPSNVFRAPRHIQCRKRRSKPP